MFLSSLDIFAFAWCVSFCWMLISSLDDFIFVWWFIFNGCVSLSFKFLTFLDVYFFTGYFCLHWMFWSSLDVLIFTGCFHLDLTFWSLLDVFIFVWRFYVCLFRRKAVMVAANQGGERSSNRHSSRWGLQTPHPCGDQAREYSHELPFDWPHWGNILRSPHSIGHTEGIS
jgi:hypothetical protein